ncbi:MAG TPA: hypothetical protein VIM61_09625 [Chthoniobacterales bacterium]
MALAGVGDGVGVAREWGEEASFDVTIQIVAMPRPVNVETMAPKTAACRRHD